MFSRVRVNSLVANYTQSLTLQHQCQSVSILVECLQIEARTKLSNEPLKFYTVWEREDTRSAGAQFLIPFSAVQLAKIFTGRRSSQNLEKCNSNMPNSSLVAFLMILGQRYKKIFIAENLNKQMGTLSKTFPASRISVER